MHLYLKLVNFEPSIDNHIMKQWAAHILRNTKTFKGKRGEWLLSTPTGLAPDVTIFSDGYIDIIYSRSPHNRHTSTADNRNIMNNSESPDCPSIHFNP